MSMRMSVRIFFLPLLQVAECSPPEAWMARRLRVWSGGRTCRGAINRGRSNAGQCGHDRNSLLVS